MKKLSVFAPLLAFAAVGCGGTNAPTTASTPAVAPTTVESQPGSSNTDETSVAADVVLVTLNVPEMH